MSTTGAPHGTKLRVAQVCADRGIAPGATKGAAQHLRGIAAGLARAGHQVVTYSARSAEGPFPGEVRPLSELVVSLPGAVDLVYERYSLGHRDGLASARARSLKFVLEVNAPLVDEALRHRPDTVRAEHRRIEAELLAQADLVIAVSSELQRWAAGHRAGPTLRLTNGFEPSWFPAPTVTGTAPGLVFLGHPKPWHGAERLIDLLVDLREAGLTPELKVIGGGAGADQLVAAARAAGVAEQLVVTGALAPQQASAALAGATIGLAPYPRQAGFYFCPLKVVDYLAAGLAIVATDQGDVTELVGDAGLVVDPDDRGGFATAVAELLVDPKRCATLGARGRARATASMTWDHVAAATVDAMVGLWSNRVDA